MLKGPQFSAYHSIYYLIYLKNLGQSYKLFGLPPPSISIPGMYKEAIQRHAKKDYHPKLMKTLCIT